MSDNKNSVKIQHLIDEAERLPKQEAIVVLRALQAAVAGENGNWNQVVGTAIERIKERKETADGRIASNSEDFICDLGRYFNTEIKHTRNLLSAAKRTENFMSVFDRLNYLAQAYYDQDEGLMRIIRLWHARVSKGLILIRVNPCDFSLFLVYTWWNCRECCNFAVSNS